MLYHKEDIKNNMKKTALIMAGGRGERFWPRSRKKLPKQFLSLTDDGKTMIQLTVERILPIINIEDIYVATNKDYKQLVLEQLPDMLEKNIICEPIGKNTAPCIGLVASYIEKEYGDAIMVVLPSDHLIKYTGMFTNTLNSACELAAEGNNLVTIGIMPDYPETGYGYIKFNSNCSKGQAYKVDNFVEKPNLETAKSYLATEEYLWNSGMFIWKASSILENIETFLPELSSGLKTIQEEIGTENEYQIINTIFPSFTSISIDIGIMEHAKDIYIFPGMFGWDDVGSWLAIERIKSSNEAKNVVNGNIITINTHNCIIEGSNKLIATVGLEDLIIVDTQDATLICNKNSAGDIKKVVENLKICNRIEYI